MRLEANQEIKKLMNDNNLRRYLVAHKMGVHRSTLTGWLRFEMSPEQKCKVIKAIYELLAEKEIQLIKQA